MEKCKFCITNKDRFEKESREGSDMDLWYLNKELEQHCDCEGVIK